ncbi:unnamed protein product, partial [Effrenium voratum]
MQPLRGGRPVSNRRLALSPPWSCGCLELLLAQFPPGVLGFCPLRAETVSRLLLPRRVSPGASRVRECPDCHGRERLRALHDSSCFVRAVHIQLFVDVLPEWLPAGICVVRSDGLLLHFSSSYPVRALLPTHVAAAVALGAGPRLVFYNARDAHFQHAALQPHVLPRWGTVRCMRFLELAGPLLAHVAETMEGGMPAVKKSFTEKAILQAFENAEQVVFPLPQMRALMPAVMQHCEVVAGSLSVPVSWVLLAGICAASFLAPTACLLAEKTIPLYTMPWAFILHPDATQTSGLMAAYSRAMRQIELWENEYQAKKAWQATCLLFCLLGFGFAKDSHTLALQAFRQQPEGAAAHEGEADSSAKRPRYSQPAPMHMGFTSGSVDGVIGRMADRTTVLVDAPCIGVCAAVHMEELMAALGEE